MVKIPTVPKPVKSPSKVVPIVETTTSFGTLVEELKSPTSYVGRLNRSREFMEGFEASRRGVTRKRNPYGFPSTSEEAKEWQEGWKTQFHGESV